MIARESFIKRRRELMQRIGSGVVLLPGNSLVPFNYQNNTYPFRQDSTFRYLFGVNRPSLVGIIDIEAGESHIFGDEFTLDDIIWSGEQPSIAEQSMECGVERTHPLAELKNFLDKAISSGRKVHLLPPYRAAVKSDICELLDITPTQLAESSSIELLFAIASMREVKSDEEIAELDKAFDIGYSMHTQAMRMCHAGVNECEISAAIESIAKSRGAGLSFQTIATQRGEQLHSISPSQVLREGAMFLCDAGAESLSGYCSDNTRTYPVGGHFTPLQRDLYNIVLASYNHTLEIARPMPYAELHRADQLRLADGLINMGLITSSSEDAVESGAITLFMPHGLGHGLGMDVHDCENIGERSLDLSQYRELSESSRCCITRSTWLLRKGCVVTNEPGLYFIPALIEKRRGEGLYRGIVNYPALEPLYGFGGIRIEDTITITDNGCRVLGKERTPLSAEQIEEFMQQNQRI